MKKEDLIELGIDEEVAKQVMTLHGKTVTTLNGQLSAAEGERDQFKEQLTTNQKELDALKDSAEGNEELTQQLADLQEKYDNSKTESETKLATQQKDFAIRLALKEVKPLDEDIVLGQLNTETIQLTAKGLLGLQEQLDELQENKSFLFQQEEQQQDDPNPQIVTGGNKGRNGQNEDDPFAAKLEKYN